MLRAHVIHIFGPGLRSFNYTPVSAAERDAVEHLFNCGRKVIMIRKFIKYKKNTTQSKALKVRVRKMLEFKYDFGNDELLVENTFFFFFWHCVMESFARNLRDRSFRGHQIQM